MSIKVYVECEQCEACVAPSPLTFGESWYISSAPEDSHLSLDLRIWLPEPWSLDRDSHIFCSIKCLEAYRAEHLEEQIADLQEELKGLKP